MSEVVALVRVDELERILALPVRPPVDCSRRPGSRGWSPIAEALVEVVTKRYARPTVSCACDDRRIVRYGDRVVVTRTPLPGLPPLPPAEVAYQDLLRDVHAPADKRMVADLRHGGTLDLPGLGRPCIRSLNPVQAWALREFPRAQGIFGMMSVGSGKTYLSILAPLAVDCRLAIILIKPDQRIHYRAAYLRLREHFRVPSLIFDRSDEVDARGTFIVRDARVPVAHVIPYSLLSNPKSTTLLEELAADTVIADEWHLLSNRGSTRTTRFLRYMSNGTNKRLAGWSGSTIKKSVKDAAHLAAHSLGLTSPYPIPQDDAEAFAAVIDPSPLPDRTSPTARRLLTAFGREGARPDDPIFQLGMGGDGGVREGFRARIVSTLGVIATSSGSAACSLTIRERVPPKLSDDVRAKLTEARGGRRPDGEVLTEPVEMTACAKNIGAGYYHFWAYPRGEPKEVRDEWFACRQAWNRELRGKLIYGEPHLDSPHLCANAAERAWREPRYDGPLPVWPASTWPAWAAIRDAVEPDPRTLVFDDFLAADAAAWAAEHRGIVWVQSRAFGQRIAALAGINYHGGGPDAEAKIRAEDGSRSIVASLKAHGESRDELQFKFCKQLFAELMSSADRWEQALGRLVRQGQPADTVDTYLYRHITENRDAFRNAILYAEYIEATTPNKQLILAADCEFEV